MTSVCGVLQARHVQPPQRFRLVKKYPRASSAFVAPVSIFASHVDAPAKRGPSGRPSPVGRCSDSNGNSPVPAKRLPDSQLPRLLRVVSGADNTGGSAERTRWAPRELGGRGRPPLSVTPFSKPFRECDVHVPVAPAGSRRGSPIMSSGAGRPLPGSPGEGLCLVICP